MNVDFRELQRQQEKLAEIKEVMDSIVPNTWVDKVANFIISRVWWWIYNPLYLVFLILITIPNATWEAIKDAWGSFGDDD